MSAQGNALGLQSEVKPESLEEAALNLLNHDATINRKSCRAFGVLDQTSQTVAEGTAIANGSLCVHGDDLEAER